MKYLRVFLLALALPLLLLAAFNAAIDPYGVLGAPVRPGINDVKYLGNDRLVKPLRSRAFWTLCHCPHLLQRIERAAFLGRAAWLNFWQRGSAGRLFCKFQVAATAMAHYA